MAVVSFENISSSTIASFLPSLWMLLAKKHLVDLILADFCLESVVEVSSGGLGTVKKTLAIFCSKIEGLEMEYVLCLYC